MTQYQVKLIEETLNGKYLVMESGDSRLLVAFKPEGIGGHSDMLATLNRIQDGEEEDIESEIKEIIKGGGDRSRLREALKGIRNMDYFEGIGGGQYSIEEGKLELFGKSYSFGPVEPAILKEFEAPIRQYCAKEGLELKTLTIEQKANKSEE